MKKQDYQTVKVSTKRRPQNGKTMPRPESVKKKTPKQWANPNQKSVSKTIPTEKHQKKTSHH